MFNYLFNNSYNEKSEKFTKCIDGTIGSYVINMDAATDRLEFVMDNIIALGFPTKRISAVNGKTLSDQKIKSITDINTYKNYFKMMPELCSIGCSLSHEKTWIEFLTSENEFAVVFEDDVQFNPEELKRTIIDVIDKKNLWDIVAFELIHHGAPVKITKLCDNKSLVTYLANVQHTGCYLINRKAANALLKKLYPIKMPIDHYMTATWEFDIKFAGVEPRLVHQKFGNSQIKTHPAKKFKDPKTKTLNALYNIRRAITHFLYNSAAFIKSKTNNYFR